MTDTSRTGSRYFARTTKKPDAVPGSWRLVTLSSCGNRPSRSRGSSREPDAEAHQEHCGGNVVSVSGGSFHGIGELQDFWRTGSLARRPRRQGSAYLSNQG